MTCNGSPGNPGTYDVPTPDGRDVVACTGCSVCRPSTTAEQMRAIVNACENDLPTFIEAMESAMVAIDGITKYWVQQMNEVSARFMAAGAIKNRAERRAEKYGRPVRINRR